MSTYDILSNAQLRNGVSMIQILMWNIMCHQVWKTTERSVCPATIQEGAPGVLRANQKTCGLQKDQGMLLKMARGLMWVRGRLLTPPLSSPNFTVTSSSADHQLWPYFTFTLIRLVTLIVGADCETLHRTELNNSAELPQVSCLLCVFCSC